MKTMPIVAADQPGEIVQEARQMLEEVSTLLVPRSYDLDELKSMLAQATGLFSWGNIKLGEAILASAPYLKVIGVVGVGCDHIDVASATRRGVIVGNGPGSNAEAVAEFTILLILALFRNFIQAQSEIKAKCWSTADKYCGLELQGATLGLVGFGNIGRRVAELATGFGMAVLAFDPYLERDATKERTAKLTDLDEMLSQADVVSIHAPLSPATQGLIGEKEISLMKPGAYLVNTARAPIVDEEALYRALLKGHIKAAATDVFPKEPPDLSRPIYDLENFIVTPHIAAITDAALCNMQVEAAKAIVEVLNSRLPRSVVNRDVLTNSGGG